MGLIEPGYMPGTYYADRYFMADYWPEHGEDETVFVRGSASYSDPLVSDVEFKDPLVSDVEFKDPLGSIVGYR